MAKWWILVVVFVFILGGVAALFLLPPKTANAPGNTPQWVTERGNKDILRNISIKPGDSVSSPLTVTGEARGTWYFEASFPINLTDWDGKIIAQVPAQAQSDWMTEEFVPFTAILEFKTPAAGDPSINRGTLILKKDNPSGLPEKEDSLEIPVVFK